MNQSVALAKAGAEVYHAGCIGEDGEMLRKILAESKVNTDYLKEVSGKNGHAIIQLTKQGENSIFLYPGSNEMVTKDYIDLVLADFNEEDIILLQNEISNVDYIIQRAHEKKMCIILNPSPFNEKMSEIDFNMISYIILNEVEANGISGLDSWEESLAFIRKKYPDLKVILTIGSKGCVYSDKTFECRQSAFKVEVVDTTAAGDTFTGYFVSELSKGTEYDNIPFDVIECEKHMELNRKMAQESMVLLKNNGILPLKEGTKIAVIGPLADSYKMLLANYNGEPSKYYTLLRGLQEYGDVIYSKGSVIHRSKNHIHLRCTSVKEAIIAANHADVVVLCLGIDPDFEGEQGDAYNSASSGDKADLEIPDIQQELYNEIIKLQKPVVYVNVSGSCLNLKNKKKNVMLLSSVSIPVQWVVLLLRTSYSVRSRRQEDFL